MPTNAAFVTIISTSSKRSVSFSLLPSNAFLVFYCNDLMEIVSNLEASLEKISHETVQRECQVKVQSSCSVGVLFL